VIYQVDAKKRVAILPEARDYFDENGEIIDGDGNTDNDDEDEADENGAGPSQPRS
jgi:hypothetical protein